MQKQPELDWVSYVLRDVITFLAENEMMQSARMLAIAAAHIEHDMKRPEPVPKATIAAEANVVKFPNRSRRLI